MLTKSSPVTSNKVVEYRERNLRPFLFTESLQIIQSTLMHLYSSAQPTGLGQGTEMAMAEAWFCFQLTIFVLIMN